jgi:RNA polymerase sigma-70 factor, ECF subfamily
MLNPTLIAKINADYAGLMSLVNRKVHDRELAADLINQAFVESLNKLAAQQIADPSRFSGFVYGVAFNLLRNHRRLMDNRLHTRTNSIALESLASDESPIEQRQRDDVARQIRRVIKELPSARDRELIRRFYLEEQCKAAICRDMGLSPLTFDKIVFKARGRLKRLLAAWGFEREDFFCSPSRRTPSRWLKVMLSK